MTLRLAITAPSAAHAALVLEWSRVTGRSVSSMGSFLLEEGIRSTLRNGEVPPSALEVFYQDHSKNIEE